MTEQHNHLGDPCVHCGTSHDDISTGPCPKGGGISAEMRALYYWIGRLSGHEKSAAIEKAGLEANIQKCRTKIAQEAVGLNLEAIELAEKFLIVSKYSSGGDERNSARQDAIKWFATGQAGYRGLKYEYFGTKSYARWYGQRCDCEYGYGPRHGSIIFKIGLREDARSRDLTDAEKDAAIYYLMNIEKIQMAKDNTEGKP